MKETIQFTLNKAEETELVKLKTVLANQGIEVEYNIYAGSISFSYDDQILNKRATRDAGRKEKKPAKQYTYGEILTMKENMSSKEIANLLEYSESTYFRRLKHHKVSNSKSDD